MSAGGNPAIPFGSLQRCLVAVLAVHSAMVFHALNNASSSDTSLNRGASNVNAY
jgi:hypothetical protein